MTNEIIVNRLSIIKLLFEAGVKQSLQSEIISYSALLSFHDSIDMFMNLAAEKKGLANRRSLFLIQHFDAIPELTLKASVNKINDRRNNLKHNGQIPAKIEVEDSKAITKLFFEENTQIIFGMPFDDITLANLIVNPRIRNWINEAESLLSQNRIKESIVSIAKAFHELEQIQKRRLIDGPNHNIWQNELYIITTEFTSNGLFINNPFSEGQKLPMNETQHWLNFMYKQNFGYIFNALNYMSLGVEFRDIVRFKRIVPDVVGAIGNDYIVAGIKNEELLESEKASFALNFVLRFALLVQNNA